MSEALTTYLTSGQGVLPAPLFAAGEHGDLLGNDDLQLALHCCYELHYRGFAGVDPDLEWDLEVLGFRRHLERLFEFDLRRLTPISTSCTDAAAAIVVAIERSDGPSLSTYLSVDGSLEQLREFMVHRSAYQLKEADPHTWGLPRLDGRAKSAMIEIQMDEYGNGVPGAAHAELFADTLRAL